MPELSEIKFEFDNEAHRYSERGEILPHCTGMLETLGIIDYFGTPSITLERKALLGSLVHEATQYMDLDGLSTDLSIGMVYDSALEQCDHYGITKVDMHPYVVAYDRFRLESGFVPRLVEHRMIAEVSGMRYGMQVDREGLLAKLPTIIDLKCTHQREKSWPVQLAGYALGLPRGENIPRWERVALWLRPDSTYQICPGGRDRSDRILERRDEEVFLAALRCAWWRKENLGHF